MANPQLGTENQREHAMPPASAFKKDRGYNVVCQGFWAAISKSLGDLHR